MLCMFSIAAVSRPSASRLRTSMSIGPLGPGPPILEPLPAIRTTQMTPRLLVGFDELHLHEEPGRLFLPAAITPSATENEAFLCTSDSNKAVSPFFLHLRTAVAPLSTLKRWHHVLGHTNHVHAVE